MVTARKNVSAEILAESVRLAGPGVLAACEAVGAPRMRDPRCRDAWLVKLSRADDVLAHLEHVQRRHVELVEMLPEVTR